MGTRFVCTKEAPVHENIKKAIAGGTERDTLLIFRTLHNTGRVFKNAISEEVVRMERRPGGTKFEEIRDLVAGARGRTALQSGDINGGLVWASMAAGLIDDIPSCGELIERIVRECREHLSMAQSLAA
jgi:nitronate monooxygenase